MCAVALSEGEASAQTLSTSPRAIALVLLLLKYSRGVGTGDRIAFGCRSHAVGQCAVGQRAVGQRAVGQRAVGQRGLLARTASARAERPRLPRDFLMSLWTCESIKEKKLFINFIFSTDTKAVTFHSLRLHGHSQVWN